MKHLKYYTKHKSIFIRARLYITFLMIGVASVARGFEWIIFIALIPMISYMPHIKNYSRKTVRRDFYWSSFLLCGFAYFFLFQMAPQNWTVVLTGWFAVVSRVVAWALVSFFCALSFLIVGIILLKIKRFKYQLIALPFLWVFGEILRTYLYAVMAYGPGGSLSPNFNWGSIAVSASGTPLVFASRWVGFYGLTFLVVVVNIAVFVFIFKKRYLEAVVVVAAIVLLTYTGWKQGINSETREIDVAILHLNEKDNVAIWDGVDKPKQGTDLLVLPEYSEFFDNKDAIQITSRLSENGLGVTSEPIGRSPEGTNQIVYFDNMAAKVSKQDKTFLIPTGEYMPYSLQAAFYAIAKEQALNDFKYSQQITRGKSPEQPYNNGKFSIGALACSGVNALSEYRKLKNDGADILVNSASLSFLSNKSLYHVYAYNMARFQAVSNNRPFVQASRSGESYILNNQGREIVRHDSNQTKLLQSTLKY
jgi:apolipoprotein N-acyltransferase